MSFHTTSARSRFCNSFGTRQSPTIPSHNPTASTPAGLQCIWFRLIPVRSPLLGESLFTFYSSGYLDVSVPQVVFQPLFIQDWMAEHYQNPLTGRPGFPIRKSRGQGLLSDSPELIAAARVLHRLPVPRHPPCALSSLTMKPFSTAPSPEG